MRRLWPPIVVFWGLAFCLGFIECDWIMYTMHVSYSDEFKADVLALVHRGDASIPQIARDVGVSDTCIRKWLQKDAGGKRGSGPMDSSNELKELKRCNRLLGQELEVFRRAHAYISVELVKYPKKRFYPLILDLATTGILRVLVVMSPRVLQVSRQAYYK